MSTLRRLLVVFTAMFTFLASYAHAQLTWTQQTSGTTQDLREVWGSDPANVWAVGVGGTILKYNGTAWTAQTSGTTETLVGVWGTSSTNVWAVGNGGTILKYNGTSWTAQTSNTTADLRSVWGADASNVWAVGGSGVIMQFNGTTWAAQTSGTTKLLFGVSGTSASNVWAVGFDGAIRRWDGTAWAGQTSNNVNSYFGIYVADANNAWAVEDNSDASRWNGSTWSTQDVGSLDQLLGVSGSSASDVRAIGTSGTVRKYNGSTWNADATLATNVLHGIWAANANQWWIVGENGSIYSGAPASIPTAVPTVSTTNPGTVGSTTVFMGGNVTADGGGTVSERGIVWGLAASPTIANNKFQIGSGTGSYSGTVTGLPPTTLVFARAYATNALGTGYGAETSFTTLSNNADLSSLTITATELSPAFAANVTSYTASVPNGTTSITVTPTVALANATVTVNTVTVTSGSPSGSIALNVGSNVINTVVTAQDGSTTKSYTLTVTRAAPVLAGGPITPTAVLTTSQWVGPTAGVRARMIDGSGLSGGGSVFTQTHDELVTANTIWHAGPDSGGISGGVTGPPPFGPPPVNTQAVEFDLGANYDLSAAHIWNMNQAGNIGRGVKDVQILISSATTGAFTALTTTQFSQGTGAAGLAAQVVPLTGAINVRRVRFSIQTAWSGAASDYVGLSEVRFQGTPYTVTPAPTLTSVSPATGSTLGGTSVTLTGTNFTGATGVTFGGAAATAFTVDSATTITATTPAGTAGTASVLVTTAGGTNAANSLFTYMAPNTDLFELKVRYFDPGPNLIPFDKAVTSYTLNATETVIAFSASPEADPGATLEYQWNGAAYTPLTSGVATLKSLATTGANTLLVRVTNGTAQKVYTVNITYTPPPPTLTSVSPATGSTAGGTSVTLTGTNFTGATGVTFGGTAATAFTVDSATQITATTPAHAAGAVSVIVTTPGGSNAANTLFTYGVGNAAPIIRNAFGLELPAALSLDHAENIAFSDTLLVTDANSDQNHTWALSGHDAAKFTVHPATGAFALANTLDFENHTDHDMNGVYEVTVTVTDSGTPAMSDSIALSFTIQNDNDAPTVSAIAAQSTNEDTPKTIAFTVADQDAGQSVAALVVTATVHVDDTALIPQTAENIVLGGSGASRTLTLTPAPNANGTATITVKVSDGQAEHHTTSRTFTLTVTPLNDAPTFTLAENITRFPGSGAYTQAGFVSAISRGPADENGQSIALSLPTVTNPTLFAVAPTLAGNGTLRFTPGNTAGKSTVTVRAQDNGGTENGGVNFTEKTFTITISSLAVTFANVTMNEDSTLAVGPAGFTGSPGPILNKITASSNPTLIPFDANAEAAATVTLTPAANQIGTSTITVESSDGFATVTNSFTVTVNAVNDAPTFTLPAEPAWTERLAANNWTAITSSADGTKLAAVTGNVDQDTPLPDIPGRIFLSQDSGQTWIERSERGTFDSLYFSSITSSADGSKLAAVDFDGLIYTSSDSGKNWTPREQDRNWRAITTSADGSKLAAVVGGGQIYTSTDSGATWMPRMTDADRNWKSITSSAAGNKLAAVVDGGQIYTSTDYGVTWVARDSARAWESITSSADGSKLAAVVSGGQIYTSTDSGATWTARASSNLWESITSSADGNKLAAASRGKVHTSIDSGVTWTEQASSFGGNSITSSADGNKLATAKTDAGHIHTYEGPRWQNVAALSGLFTQTNFATAISPGPADESAQTVSFTVTTDKPGLFSVQPAIAPNGTLTFTPGRDAGNATVTVRAVDTGGTANGGVNSSEKTFTITITKPLKLKESVFLVGLQDMPESQNRFVPENQKEVLFVTSETFGIDNNLPITFFSLDTDFFTLTPTTASGLSVYELKFKTSPNYEDLTPSNNVGGRYGVRLDVGSAGSPLGSDSSIIIITVTDVNEMPSFTKGANVTNIPAIVAPQIIPGWATAITDGDSLATQGLTFTFTPVSQSNRLSVGPAIDPATGNLTFTPSGLTGTARYRVTLTDDASINGGVALTTAEQTFDLVFTAVAPGTGTAEFTAWPALAALPVDQRGPNATPANDGVSNLVKFALGIGPLDSATGLLPQQVAKGTGTAADFPTVSFVRKKGLIGVAVNVEVGSSLDFTTTTLGSVITGVQDLGNGTERVTVRSTAPFTGNPTQFFRLSASAN